MNSEFSNLDFESLVERIKQLSQSEKDKLMVILKDNSFVEEEALVYSKVQSKNSNFEKKWSESMTSEQFKNASIKHIDSLPWK